MVYREGNDIIDIYKELNNNISLQLLSFFVFIFF